MSQAIQITLKKAENGYDPAASKFFGAPVVPEEWLDKFSDDTIFFGQIRLADLAAYDPEHRLPHTGYLYLFLDTAVYPYVPWAAHYDGEVQVVIDDFNDSVPDFSHLNQAFLMSFSEAEETADGTKLFGVPVSEPDEDGELLLQFDPLAAPTGFLEEIDGYAYFFFGKGERRLADVRFVIDRS